MTTEPPNLGSSAAHVASLVVELVHGAAPSMLTVAGLMRLLSCMAGGDPHLDRLAADLDTLRYAIGPACVACAVDISRPQ